MTTTRANFKGSILDVPSNATYEAMNKVFKRDGLIVPVSHQYVSSLPCSHRQYYCHQNGIYGLITHQLINFVQILINDFEKAIEIGSGNATLGRALGIPLTDSYQQDQLMTKMIYKMSGQPTIQYPADVEKLDGLAAVKKYQPQVVVGSWITNKYDPQNPDNGGNMHGVDVIEMMKLGVQRYILVGNLRIHGINPLLNWEGCEAQILKPEGLFSRSAAGEMDRVFVFDKR